MSTFCLPGSILDRFWTQRRSRAVAGGGERGGRRREERESTNEKSVHHIAVSINLFYSRPFANATRFLGVLQD